MNYIDPIDPQAVPAGPLSALTGVTFDNHRPDPEGYYLPDTEGDLLVGAGAIAKLLYGSAKQRRKVYYRVERGEIPHFYMGGTVCSTRSALTRMIVRQMREADRDLGAE